MMHKIVFTNQPFGNGDLGVIKALFLTCIDSLFNASPSHPNLNCEIRITYGTREPQVRFGGNCINGYDIDLNATDTRWDQHLYQFGHEACHILAQFQQHQHFNQWFEESLCEIASLYTLKSIAALGATGKGPCVNLWAGGKPYYGCLDQYADGYIMAPDRQYGSSKMQQWVQQFGPAVRRDPYCRNLNGTLANKLLPKFIGVPSNWGAVEFLNVKPCTTGQDSLLDYLNNWKAGSPPQYHALIDDIEAILV